MVFILKAFRLTVKLTNDSKTTVVLPQGCFNDPLAQGCARAPHVIPGIGECVCICFSCFVPHKHTVFEGHQVQRSLSWRFKRVGCFWQESKDTLTLFQITEQTVGTFCAPTSTSVDRKLFEPHYKDTREQAHHLHKYRSGSGILPGCPPLSY